SSRRRHTRFSRDWSSDVCSSDLAGLNVNEGPVALHHNGRTFIIYSASYCATPDYKLGMLTYTGGDPLSADSWVKHPEPVFQRSRSEERRVGKECRLAGWDQQM